MSRYEKNLKSSITSVILLVAFWIGWMKYRNVFFIQQDVNSLKLINYMTLMFAICIVFALMKLLKDIITYLKFNSAGLKMADKMDGHDFEYFCANLLKKNNFTKVRVTKGSGDFGVDIIAKMNGRSYAIQCKRYSKNVGVKAVQEAISGKEYYKCKRAVVMTNSFFTAPAIELAQKTNVILWDRRKLKYFLKIAEKGKKKVKEKETKKKKMQESPMVEEPVMVGIKSDSKLSEEISNTCILNISQSEEFKEALENNAYTTEIKENE